MTVARRHLPRATLFSLGQFAPWNAPRPALKCPAVESMLHFERQMDGVQVARGI